MSTMAAIDTAVRHQIATDGKSVGLNDKLKGGTGYVDEEEVRRFLLGVAARLKLDSPPLIFRWDSLSPNELMGTSLMMVISLIGERTIASKAPSATASESASTLPAS